MISRLFFGNKKTKNDAGSAHSMILTVVAITFVALLILESFFQYVNNQRNSYASTNAMLSNVKDIILKNDENIKTLSETLKNEYQIRVKSVAYTLSNIDRDFTVDQYKEFAKTMEIDEIHIFDKNGRIVDGSVPQYWGMTMGSGEQIGYFKPVLRDYELVMCQDVTPNTAEKKQMMYAMCWMNDHSYIVQIGITPERLLQEMEKNHSANLISQISFAGEGLFVAVVDGETHRMVVSSDEKMMNDEEFYYNELFKKIGQEETKQFCTMMKGGWYYVSAMDYDGYYIAVAQSFKVAHKGLVVSTLILVCALIVSWLVIYLIQKRFLQETEQHEFHLALALSDAKQANVAKTTFLNNMSHDIRTPMNAIIGFTNIAKRQNHDADVAASLEKISSSSEHLLSLINNVLDISRIESGKIVYEPKPVDLRKLVDDVFSIIQGNLAGRDLNFITKRNVLHPYVYADALRMKEILVNILGNAIKFTKDGGTITYISEEIESAREGYAMISFVISDTGIGMSQEFIEHLFDEFAQEESDARTLYKGSGLGMAIVKKYIDMMGGTIVVESKKGEGTTFEIRIPMKLADVSEIGEHEITEVNVDLKDVKVLLAEDNDLNAEIAQTLLEELGMKVTRAADGKKAVALFSSGPEGMFDLILMDIMMPEMNGYDAARAIRRLNKKGAETIPIIAMTANAFSEDVQAAFDAGMNGHIAKPVSPEEMLKTIKRCLL